MVNCNAGDSVNSGGGGESSGKFRNFKGGGGGGGRGVEEFLGSRGNEDLWGISKFSGSRGRWPMSDNDIFQGRGVQTPDDTMRKVYQLSDETKISFRVIGVCL